MHNAREAAAAGLDFDQASLIKTLAYTTPGGWLLVAMRALDRVDHGALAKAASIERRKLKYAAEADLERSFGWQVGGAAPIPLIEAVTIIVDHAVLELPRIFFGGGRRDITVETRPDILFGAMTHVVAAVAKKP